MLLKDVILSKICTIGQASGFSLQHFVYWARMVDKPLLIRLLDEIQAYLDEEERYFKEMAALAAGALPHHKLCRQWCLNCAQLRAYYYHYNKNDERGNDGEIEGTH